MEECVANIVILGPTVEECVAKNMNFGPMRYSILIYSQNCEFLDPCIKAEECVANNLIFSPCITAKECVANLLIFSDPRITVKDCVAKIVTVWTHALQQRNV